MRLISLLSVQKLIKNRTISSNHRCLSLAYNAYETLGDSGIGNPIIIMHGLFGSKQNWKSLSKTIHLKTVPKRKVYAVDARNHGDSPHSEFHSYDDLADDVAEFYQQHNIKKSIVIGHSMGGRAMMSFALKYPELVEKIIIVDVSPTNSSSSLKAMGNLFRAMTKVHIPNELPMSAGRVAADKQLQAAISDKFTRDFILMNLSKDIDGSFKWRVNVNALNDNFKTHVSTFPSKYLKQQYKGPTLFVGGSLSDYIIPSSLPDIQKIFPKARLEFIQCGHLVHVEKPQEFLALILNFINSKVSF